MMRRLAREYRVHWKRHLLIILTSAAIGYILAEVLG